jgi:hypothetical protein
MPPERARITSLEAIETFRNSLILYLEKARGTLDEIADTAMRTRLWLENDRHVYWEAQIRRRARALEQAQQELFSARLSKLREVTQAEQMAVLKAKRELTEAESRLAQVKQWTRQFESRIAPLANDVDRLRDVLVHCRDHGVASLTKTISTLAAYAELATGESASAPASTQDSSTASAQPGDGAHSSDPASNV